MVNEGDNKTTKPSAGSEMSKRLMTILIVLAILVVLGLIFYTRRNLLVSDDVTVFSQNNGETVRVTNGDDEVVISNDQKWPDTLPSAIPEFKAGNISASSRVEDVWSVQLDNVTKSDLDSYKASLVSAGWVVNSEVSVSTAESWMATKENYSLSATLSLEDNTLMLTVATDSTDTN